MKGIQVEPLRGFSLCIEPVEAERSVGFVAVAGEEAPSHAFFRAPGDAGERAGVIGKDGNGVAAPGAGDEVILEFGGWRLEVRKPAGVTRTE